MMKPADSQILESNDLNTFWNDKKLDPCNSIFHPRPLLKAIQQSNISVIVFKNYASSIWCLEELSEIFARIHEPLPIFYDVDPSELQNKSNSFEKAFTEHEQRLVANLRKVNSWRLAMKQVSTISLPWWDLPSKPEEPQVIDTIVIDTIVREIKRKMRELVYADADLVGMQSRVKEIEELLDLGNSNDEIRVVGICGMSGMGKTVLERVLYDRISHHFDASFHVLDGIEFCRTTGLKHHKRTLKVLDRPDSAVIIEQLYNMLDGGSRIIVTTRDEGVLRTTTKHRFSHVINL